MNQLLEIISGTIDVRITWELKKSTKMNISRYLETMHRMLLDHVQSELIFNQLPSNIVLCEGNLDRVMDTTDNTIQITLHLSCKKITGEDNQQSGNITLNGTAKLGRMNLAFHLLMASNVIWKGKQDPAHTKLQSQNLSIPLTQLDMTTREVLHKLTFYNKGLN